MVFGAAVNVGAEYFAYRKLRNAPKLAPLMTAVGLSFVFRGIGQLDVVNGSAPKNWPQIVWGGPIVGQPVPVPTDPGHRGHRRCCW